MIARRIERPMRQVMAALEQIRQGRFAVKMGSEAPGELGDLQRSIVKMSADLSVVQTGLEAAVHERTMQLETAMEEKASLIANTHLALEHERKRIAQDIHDQLNPSVVAIQFAAAQLQPKQGKSTDPEKVRSVAQEISASATQVYDAARRIVRSLRPEVLDTLGFEAALTELVRSFNEMESGCEFRLEFGHDVPKISPDIAMTAYRVTQEALSNVVKHSGARKADIRVAGEGNDTVRLAISDNGRGFDPHGRVNGLGLIGMRERVAAWRGTFDCVSSPAGTTVTVRLPDSDRGGTSA